MIYLCGVLFNLTVQIYEIIYINANILTKKIQKCVNCLPKRHFAYARTLYII